MQARETIEKTFKHHIGKDARRIHKIEGVPNNQVFKIETEAEAYILKIYANSDWPENGKLPYVAKMLGEHKIPHAKLFVFERNNDDFPNGYLIEECLPGVSADRLSLSDEETLALYQKLAMLISRVHRIELSNYGYTGSGVADWTTFSEFIYDMLDDLTATLREQGIVNALQLDAIREVLYVKLKECDCYPSVICHGDLSIKNILVVAGEAILIDWDDAQSLCWMADIARFTFWLKLNYGSAKAELYRKAFLDCYETEYDKEAFDRLEDALHVWYGLDYLNFSVATPAYHYQSDTVKAILQKSLTNCGMSKI